jgi:predicted TIM-barrel fold metal-dependent hydrolase
MLFAAQGRSAAQAPQPERPRRIVDAQVHLWKANTLDRPWPAATFLLVGGTDTQS